MVPSGQVCDSSLEKGQLYIFRVGAGQAIKGLAEGILSMKVGGKRRLYIPGSLAFPKGLTSAPGRPRVTPSCLMSAWSVYQALKINELPSS
ncbi:hypothetical protein MLD38_015171 [Melastoma candidum]|uniref:Uncharacterized protein n=1 Tax=Melastoma candidum TaxID=119954 RepID=A0ACB9RGK6_9MYRT|nr:hypothetical protein MLD38_015171 [Melastoma candidum]